MYASRHDTHFNDEFGLKNMPPHFYPPNNNEISIWRYMDFAKFVMMLDSSELFLAKSTSFDDPFEGTQPQNNLDTFAESNPGIPTDKLMLIRNALFQMRPSVFISCWHANMYESEAMWKLYSSSGDAVAIKSSFDKLEELTPPSYYVGQVQYIDYETERLIKNPNVADDIRITYMHKRKAFEHEKEIRVVAMGSPEHSGINCPIDLSKLIQEVYVSPTSSLWFETLVKTIIYKYEFDFPVRRSQLSERPNI